MSQNKVMKADKSLLALTSLANEFDPYIYVDFINRNEYARIMKLLKNALRSRTYMRTCIIGKFKAIDFSFMNHSKLFCNTKGYEQAIDFQASLKMFVEDYREHLRIRSHE